MKFRLCRVEFAISLLEEIKYLLRAWERHLLKEGQPVNRPIRVDVMLEPRLPGEPVTLSFTASPEIMDRFLARLKEVGLEFSCDEIIPGLFSMCRVEQECF